METVRSGSKTVLKGEFRKTGIFGGTLDPIHLGHLRSAEEVMGAFDLQEMWFIPAARPPHKDTPGISPFRHRLRMAELATEGNSRFRVLDMESQRPGPSFSIDTLRELHQRYGSSRRFFFIMGADAFLEIEKWKEYQGLVDFCSIIIMSREDTPCDETEAIITRAWPDFTRHANGWFENGSDHGIFFQQVTRLDISGTSIREMARRGRSVRYLVPENVREYMDTNRLYAVEGNQETDGDSQAAAGGSQDRAVSKPDAESMRAVEIARAIYDNKGEDIVVLDIRGMSAFADFFIIAHGRSTRHVEGITGKIRRSLREKKIRCKGIEGETESKWVLMDYDDCIVHIFYEPVRSFYDLEGLWADAPRLQWQDTTDQPPVSAQAGA